MRTALLFLIASSLTGQTVNLKVAAVQFRSSHNIEDNRKRIIEVLDRLSSGGVQVAAFPECALTGYHKDAVMAVTAKQIATAEEQIASTCRLRKIAVVMGGVYKVNGKTYDTATVFDSRGRLVERYAKLMLAGEQWATPGNHIAFFELEGVPSTVIICHDERYPEFVRLPAMQGARIVYYSSSESGMTEESKLAPYRAQMMARAVENHVFVVAANSPADAKNLGGSSHGQSRIIADDGNVLKEASHFGEDILVEMLSIKPGRLDRPLQGATGDWWRLGIDWMMKNRTRPLE